MIDNDQPWICPACGDKSESPADECPSCGAISLRAVGNKKRKTAILLAVLLGWCGVHRFYLGQHIKGVFYLVFFWTFIPLLFSWIDAFGYLILGPLGFNEKYNRLVPVSEAPDDVVA